MFPRSHAQRSLMVKYVYLGVLLMLIFLNLNLFMAPSATSPSTSASVPLSALIQSKPALQQTSGKIVNESASRLPRFTPSNAGQYISSLQDAILSEQEAIGQIEAQNKMLADVLHAAAAQEDHALHAPQASIQPSQSPSAPLTFPGLYKIKSVYLERYWRSDSRKKFVGIGTGFDDLDKLSFELDKPDPSANIVTIKEKTSGKYLGMRAPNERLDWTIVGDCSAPSDSKCHFELREEKYLFSPRVGAYVNIIGAEHIRGHKEGGGGPAEQDETSELLFIPVTNADVKQGIDEKAASKEVMKYMESPKERDYIKMIKELPKSDEVRSCKWRNDELGKRALLT